MKVAFINTFAAHDPWTQNVVEAMQAAAEDLGIELVVVHPGYWPAEVLQNVDALLSGPDRPDYVVVSVRRTLGGKLLEVAQRNGIPSFLINAGLPPREQAHYGDPREALELWLGQMTPADEQAGYDLAYALIEQAREELRVGPDGRVHLVALNGRDVDPAAIERERGLRRAVAERDDVVLHQVVSADWSREEARRITPLLLRRYPETKVIWAANDLMALGALDALERLGLDPGIDVLVGAMNWDPQALQEIRERDLEVTYGGHFLEGAWALVLLYDYEHGFDFGRERVVWETELLPISERNIEQFLPLLGTDRSWLERIDFRSFSRTLNPARDSYGFSATVAQGP